VPETNQRGMGRGLSAILPRSHKGAEGFREVPVELIRPNPRQPRRNFNEVALAELAESIRTRGVLQPIVLRPLPGGEYELVAGERRLRAAEIVGLPGVPAVVRDAEDWERLDLALAENMARVNLNPVEQARACAMLVEDLGITKGEVGRRVGRSRVAISNLIRLLDLPEEALELIESGDLTEGHGRAILTCKDHTERKQLALAARDAGWSVRETEARARTLEEGPAQSPRAKVVVHPDLKEALTAAEDALGAAFSREVRVRPRGDRFRIEIEVDSPAEAMNLAATLNAGGAEGARAAA
jgi:ParB family transcriptional regulator, chromosome partitioning protein